jgi:uncharacterized protein (TIGR01777 family)
MVVAMRIGITGASGLIGSALRNRLEAGGHTVVSFVRRTAAPGEIEWHPDRGELDPAALSGLDAVVNLAGAGIGDHRWTDAYKQTVLDSRVDGTRLLCQALVANGSVGVLLSGSAIGIYGDGDLPVDEAGPIGTGFLADVASAWERATQPAEAAGIRVAHLRTGIVLSANGGALRKMLPLFKLGVGGRFGDGRQWMSWITVEDEVAAIAHLLSAGVRGPVDLTAPGVVRNAEFASTLGRVLKRPALVPVPKFGPRLVLGRELADTLLFEGQNVQPSVLLADGFEFGQSELEPALRAVLGRSLRP